MLTATYRSETTVEALYPVWDMALEDVSDKQIAQGLEACLKEHRSNFLPTPAQFRTWAFNGPTETPKPKEGKPIEWWVAKDAEGRLYAWHEGLVDAKGRALPKAPSLEWFPLLPERHIPVWQIVDACGCGGRGVVELRQDRRPGPRLRIKCNQCENVTPYFEKTREAISEWNR